MSVRIDGIGRKCGVNDEKCPRNKHQSVSLYPCNTSAVLRGMSSYWSKITDYHVINYNVINVRDAADGILAFVFKLIKQHTGYRK